MAAIVTNNFRSLNAKNFMEDVRAELSNVYIGVGKSTAWQDETPVTTDYSDATPTKPADTIDHINQARANMIGMKLLDDSDVSHVAPRYDWEAGKVFVPWDSRNPDIYEEQFYCLTADFKVYKCIDAPTNGAGVSDVPVSTSASVFGTADGYRWKYMYTIIAADSEKFLTRSYMPVKTLTTSTTGQVAATISSGATTFTLDDENPDILVGQIITAVANGATTPNIAANTIVTAISGKTITASASITALYDGNTVTFGNFLSTNPLRAQQLSQLNSAAASEVGGIERIVITDGGTSFGADLGLIAAKIKIVGDGTNGAITSATEDGQASIQVTNGTITRIIPTTSGQDYSLAEIVLRTDLAPTGATGLKAYPVIAPAGGHGVDPVVELGGFYIGLNTQISGIDDIDIANNQDFRQISIVKNPTVAGVIETTAVAKARGSSRGTLRGTKFLTVNSNSTTGLNEIINLLTSGADVFIESQNENSTSKKIPGAYVVNAVNDSSGKFIYYVQDSNTGYESFTTTDVLNYQSEAALTDSTASITLTASDGSTEYNKGSGEVLFLENRAAIQRSSTQIEDVKLILEF
jgi:hypothetical protein